MLNPNHIQIFFARINTDGHNMSEVGGWKLPVPNRETFLGASDVSVVRPGSLFSCCSSPLVNFLCLLSVVFCVSPFSSFFLSSFVLLSFVFLSFCLLSFVFCLRSFQSFDFCLFSFSTPGDSGGGGTPVPVRTVRII